MERSVRTEVSESRSRRLGEGKGGVRKSRRHQEGKREIKDRQTEQKRNIRIKRKINRDEEMGAVTTVTNLRHHR